MQNRYFRALLLSVTLLLIAFTTMSSQQPPQPPTKPVVVSPTEFGGLKFTVEKPTLVYFTQEEFETLIKGIRPQPTAGPVPGGLQIIPLPGPLPGPGYIAIPRCGPGEVPVVGHQGQVHCVVSDFVDTTEARQPIPGTGCGWKLVQGRFTCSGTCSGGARCIRKFVVADGFFLLTCGCPRSRPPEIEIPRP